MKIAAIGDLHFKARGNEELISIFNEIEEEADVALLAGDLTDTGLPQEMEQLLETVGKLRFPVIAVLGNHDHENDRAEELVKMMAGSGIEVLDGSTFEAGDVGFAGIKGFCGGYGERLIQPFGERVIKQFVDACMTESVRLGEALSKLKTPHKIAILHFSPVRATLEGESLEIYPFLGTSWLGDALDNYGADFAVHGHAHSGSPKGRTKQNIPVYNVSRFVQARTSQRSYLIIEV